MTMKFTGKDARGCLNSKTGLVLAPFLLAIKPWRLPKVGVILLRMVVSIALLSATHPSILARCVDRQDTSVIKKNISGHFPMPATASDGPYATSI